MNYAKWIDDSKYCRGILLIAKGEIRKIHAKKGNDYMLSGRSDISDYFGWVKSNQIEVLKCQEEN
jgi:hypothetical protein